MSEKENVASGSEEKPFFEREGYAHGLQDGELRRWSAPSPLDPIFGEDGESAHREYLKGYEDGWFVAFGGKPSS